MGNVPGKREEETVDGGFVFPTGTVYQKCDCDLRIVRRLITELKISPFYKGLADSTDPTFLECPICFLNYPSNINYSRCCNQPICSECLIQIQQPKSGGPAICPFCVQPDFGVTYIPPFKAGENQSEKKKKAKEGKFKPLPPDSPQVVTIDAIRPNGRHIPPPKEPEPSQVRRMTISGRPSSRSSSRRAHLSSSFNSENPLPQHGTIRLQSPSRFNVRDVEAEIENLMLMEAIHLSLLEQERSEQQQKQVGTNRNSESRRSAGQSSSSSPPGGMPFVFEEDENPFERNRGHSPSSDSSSSSEGNSSRDAKRGHVLFEPEFDVPNFAESTKSRD